MLSDKKIPVLFAHKKSIYKKILDCECYDVERDALTFNDSRAVIAHPPCGPWGKMKKLHTYSSEEKELAIWAVSIVRKNGGVLEHPAQSALWKYCELPPTGETDKYGGWTLRAPQFWWGHQCQKATWFYIVGIARAKIPAIPFRMGLSPNIMCTSIKKDKYRRPEISKSMRAHTPFLLALWLVDLVKRIESVS